VSLAISRSRARWFGLPSKTDPPKTRQSKIKKNNGRMGKNSRARTIPRGPGPERANGLFLLVHRLDRQTCQFGICTLFHIKDLGQQVMGFVMSKHFGPLTQRAVTCDLIVFDGL